MEPLYLFIIESKIIDNLLAISISTVPLEYDY